MITAKGLLYFVIGFLLIGLLILVSGFSAEAVCIAGGKDMTHGGAGYYAFIGVKVPTTAITSQITSYAPYSLPYPNACSQIRECQVSYIQLVIDSYYTAGIVITNQWDCSGGYFAVQTGNGNRYQFLASCSSNATSSDDFDCNGVPDNTQTSYTYPWSDPTGGVEKFRLKYKYTNKSTGVYYSFYEGDGGHDLWTSSDGLGLPSGGFPQSTYRVDLNVYQGSGGYQTYANLGIGTGFGIGYTNDPSGAGGTLFGGDTATATSPGNATGGDSGTSVPSGGSTNDYKEMFDYLQGIQKNTKSIADSQVKLDTDLQAIKNNQAVGAGAAGTPPATVDLSATNTKLDQIKSAEDSLKTSVDAVKTDMDTEASTSGLPDGDTSAMNDNSAFSQDEMDTKYTDEKDSLTTYMDSIIFQQNPIVTVATGSGVNDGGGSSSVSVSAGQFGFSLNFSGCESQLDVIGTFFVAFCGLAGFVEILRG